MNGGDVGMIELREHLRFAAEAQDALRVAGKMLGQELQSHLALELIVAGVIDLAHPADTKQGEDFVLAQKRAGFQRHKFPSNDKYSIRRLRRLRRFFEGREKQRVGSRE